MKRFNSYHAINVFTIERTHWEFPEHKHDHYELIFIESGMGEHTLNGVTFLYQRGDVFLMTREDVHEFQIHTKTTFTFIKFTELLFVEKLDGNKRSKWSDTIKTILQGPNRMVGSIVQDVTDKTNVFALLHILKTEYAKKCMYSREAVLELFGALMVILARNMSKNNAQLANSGQTEKINDILSYIRLNAFNNDKMAIEQLASHFFMSPHYISIYVKKHSGASVQQHIIQTKMKSAELLLKQSKLNINEIAERLGFNDASHFNKIFKKYKSVSPSKFIA